MTSLLMTFIVFGLIGMAVAFGIKRRPGTITWIILAGLVLASQWILPGTRVIAVFQFHMYANYILQAFFFGVLVGLLMKKEK